jgi:AGZA family xanthine/uracil permease-like MFS transporter
MTADSVGTVAGSIFGTSTVTTFVESASGVAEGGRTGLTGVVVSVCFALCLFLSPVASIVPGCATAPALIYVGVLMLKNFAKVDMDDALSAVPAFLALVMMPLTYSISNGILIGMITYVILNMICGNFKRITAVMYILTVLFILKFIFI